MSGKICLRWITGIRPVLEFKTYTKREVRKKTKFVALNEVEGSNAKVELAISAIDDVILDGYYYPLGSKICRCYLLQYSVQGKISALTTPPAHLRKRERTVLPQMPPLVRLRYVKPELQVTRVLQLQQQLKTKNAETDVESRTSTPRQSTCDFGPGFEWNDAALEVEFRSFVCADLKLVYRDTDVREEGRDKIGKKGTRNEKLVGRKEDADDARIHDVVVTASSLVPDDERGPGTTP
ncbi:hypothetical protein CPC08DRAFT_754701 [Agrocybe pediades]|nr:hypothetical protein CPC08DRAFT_754701 [Agrocybe pediades]